jgi:ABC-type polysaccharide/polyol phosphate transport system ATPase subunit
MACIELEDVSLVYPVYGTSARSFKKTMLNFATGGRLDQSCKRIQVEALKGVSFSLQKGDRLGLVGHNGAGKSSLLKVLAQIYQPTTGRIRVEGQVHCLFDIMMGMDLELNGYENIKLRGVILGLSKKEILRITGLVEEFAELGDFLKMPIKTYSAGMRVRLAFGIIVHLFSEILLIDEIVGVGDERFVKKANAYMKSLVHESEIMVFSCHDKNIVREFCNKAMLLEHGCVKCIGPVEEVLAHYSA